MQESREADQTSLKVTLAELILINNALNEVCNPIHIDSVEFNTRLGGTLEDARALLGRISDLLGH